MILSWNANGIGITYGIIATYEEYKKNKFLVFAFYLAITNNADGCDHVYIGVISI